MKAKIFLLNFVSILLVLLPLWCSMLLAKPLQKMKKWAYEKK